MNNKEKQKTVVTGTHITIIACFLGMIASVGLFVSSVFSSMELDAIAIGAFVACGIGLYVSVKNLKRKNDTEKKDRDE